VDSYSAFFDNGRFGKTSLHSILQSADIDTIFVTGLALDYCVKYTALDGKFLGYDVYVVADATRGVDKATSEQAVTLMKQEGIHVIASMDLDGILFRVRAASSVVFLSPLVIVAWVSAFLVFL
ncbi:nicotinamidase, partial [Plakobranchus ocellatus]